MRYRKRVGPVKLTLVTRLYAGRPDERAIRGRDRTRQHGVRRAADRCSAGQAAGPIARLPREKSEESSAGTTWSRDLPFAGILDFSLESRLRRPHPFLITSPRRSLPLPRACTLLPPRGPRRRPSGLLAGAACRDASRRLSRSLSVIAATRYPRATIAGA